MNYDYTPETHFRTDGTMVYNLKQQGWKKGKPVMINDIYFQVYGESSYNIAKTMVDSLNNIFFKNSINTVNDFMEMYEKEKSIKPYHIRDGQLVFNIMILVKPDMANKYKGSDIDPYYQDERIIEFVEACFS